ncbi:uncharacterized protein LOC116198590 [Punica granatum]|uniref:DC1 domain-containing protein n=2 Tax=Punica granatum TaxID=22663 RepID=A0A218WAP3_PUNGR|nr:uncharacterized protein LOC116198590 [Punica granatum]OWM69518.1 hypothetical protein CDL15_Pgr013979 [Punica granatum]PKI38156.1 hypothetical protein CRG98_041409 [Punica granatum]
MEIEHWSHQHPLALGSYAAVEDDGPTSRPESGKSDQEAPPKCYGCDQSITGQFYACESCNFHLHKPCADLPSDQLRHPYHPPHALTLRVAWRQHNCTFCHSPILGFNYCCDSCKFYLDSRCASVHSTIKYEDRGHLYFLRENEPNTIFHCNMCNDYGGDTHLFQCVVPSCFKSFHFHCAPLPFPKVIKSECHFHPVTYVKSYLQHWHDDQYCDACENPRNPKLPVYYCAECDFAAHISCTVKEVLPSILEEYEKDAKVREDLTKDARLQRIDRRISDARYEEKRLAAELEKIAARLEVLRENRAEYISSTSPELAESSTSAPPSAQ